MVELKWMGMRRGQSPIKDKVEWYWIFCLLGMKSLYSISIEQIWKVNILKESHIRRRPACADSSTDTQKIFLTIQMIGRLQVGKTLSQMTVTIAVQTAFF